MKIESKPCLNCGASLSTSYCSACGQKRDIHRLSLQHLLHEIPHAIFHVDRGLFHTLTALFLRPGKLVFEYLNGRRAQYYNPLTLIVLCSSLCAGIWTLFPFKQALFWSTIRPSQAVTVLQDFMQIWLKFVGAGQLLILPISAGILLGFLRSMYRARIRDALVTQNLARLKSRISGWPKQLQSLLLDLAQIVFYIHVYTLGRKQTKRQEAQNKYDFYYGESLVAASFVTSASLIITALSSPFLYLISNPQMYAISISVVAVLCTIPSIIFMRTIPNQASPKFLEALVCAVYFGVGNPFGFLLAVQILNLGK